MNFSNRTVSCLACTLAISASLMAQSTAKTSPPPAPKPAKPAKPAPARMVIPQDAVETSPGLYRWSDKDGKAWIYRRSPFGVSRWPAESEPAYNKQENGVERITAVEQGDSIRFERTSPFGKRTWVRKKSELNESEKAVWEHQQKDPAASRPAGKE